MLVSMSKRSQKTKTQSNNLYEAETVIGIEDIALREIIQKLGISAKDCARQKGAVQFRFDSNRQNFHQLKSITAVYSVQQYDIPRPKALLGHQHFTQLLQQISDVIKHYEFNSFYISAAGSQSSVMQRIQEEIKQHTGLQQSNEQGDLFIRIRRDKKTGYWETLIRLTPRPLITREWRVRDMPGALNASVAYAMVELSRPTPTNVVWNLACGSATLMIERLNHTPVKSMLGCDTDDIALNMSACNLQAAGYVDTIHLICADARQLPARAQSADVLYADLPFGQLSGSHDDNLILYPELLSEAARIAKIGARLVIITHEIKLMQELLNQHLHWVLEEERMINLRGLHPRIYVLVRKESSIQ